MGAKENALGEFLNETEEMLERISLNLQKIENKQNTDNTFNELYRDMHSVKGSAHLFGCSQIGQIAHVLESALDPIRSGKASINVALVDVVYEGIDIIKSLVDAVKLDKDGKEPDFSEKLYVIIPKIMEITSSLFGGEFKLVRDSVGIEDDKHPYDKEIVPPVSPVPKQDLEVNTKEKEVTAVTEELPTKNVQQQDESKPAPQKLKKAEKTDQDSVDIKQSETLRVQVGILDKLINLVGELVLIRNQHLQYGNIHDEPELGALNQRLNIVTGELQEEIMKTRMQPIGTILTKFHRVVRDLAKDLNKQVNFTMEGTETELDKTLLEAVKDPLMHIVRNCVDHGLEAASERENVGKPPKGSVKIKAYHEGGQVIVEIEDDGKGLSPKKIGQKALEKGLVSQEKLDRLGDRDILMFIFSPGFSTAEKISNVSGRGVGMDVVRTNIERIGGTVDLSSVEGNGTVVKLKIPLTLAIIPALVVSSGGERFAIPQVKLVELVRLEKEDDDPAKGVEFLQGEPVYRLRGQLLPLVGLNETLGISVKNTISDSENIVVLNADTGTFGLVVDEIEDSADIVVKPLMQFLKDLSVYSGATVLGDGSIALTLDVLGLANRVGVFASIEKEDHIELSSHAEESINLDNADYLLVDVGAPGHYAVPLCVVNRLEEFRVEDIEVSGGQRVILYRNSLLPILSVSDFLNLPFDKKESNKETCSIVVIQKSGQLFGLEFQEIIDVINASTNIDTELRDREGILGNLLLEKGVVVLVDTYKIISSLISTFKDHDNNDDGEKVNNERSKFEILLVEDNAFFRKHVSSILESAGFKVIWAVNGEEGLKTLQAHKTISLVLSDIEMPIMDGFELAETIQKDPSINVPMVALTTRYRKSDLDRGEKVGFKRYLEKLNPEQLLVEIDNLLGVKI